MLISNEVASLTTQATKSVIKSFKLDNLFILNRAYGLPFTFTQLIKLRISKIMRESHQRLLENYFIAVNDINIPQEKLIADYEKIRSQLNVDLSINNLFNENIQFYYQFLIQINALLTHEKEVLLRHCSYLNMEHVKALIEHYSLTNSFGCIYYMAELFYEFKSNKIIDADYPVQLLAMKDDESISLMHQAIKILIKHTYPSLIKIPTDFFLYNVLNEIAASSSFKAHDFLTDIFIFPTEHRIPDAVSKEIKRSRFSYWLIRNTNQKDTIIQNIHFIFLTLLHAQAWDHIKYLYYFYNKNGLFSKASINLSKIEKPDEWGRAQILYLPLLETLGLNGRLTHEDFETFCDYLLSQIEKPEIGLDFQIKIFWYALFSGRPLQVAKIWNSWEESGLLSNVLNNLLFSTSLKKLLTERFEISIHLTSVDEAIVKIWCWFWHKIGQIASSISEINNSDINNFVVNLPESSAPNQIKKLSLEELFKEIIHTDVKGNKEMNSSLQQTLWLENKNNLLLWAVYRNCFKLLDFLWLRLEQNEKNTFIQDILLIHHANLKNNWGSSIVFFNRFICMWFLDKLTSRQAINFLKDNFIFIIKKLPIDKIEECFSSIHQFLLRTETGGITVVLKHYSPESLLDLFWKFKELINNTLIIFPPLVNKLWDTYDTKHKNELLNKKLWDKFHSKNKLFFKKVKNFPDDKWFYLLMFVINQSNIDQGYLLFYQQIHHILDAFFKLPYTDITVSRWLLKYIPANYKKNLSSKFFFNYLRQLIDISGKEVNSSLICKMQFLFSLGSPKIFKEVFLMENDFIFKQLFYLKEVYNIPKPAVYLLIWQYLPEETQRYFIERHANTCLDMAVNFFNFFLAFPKFPPQIRLLEQIAYFNWLVDLTQPSIIPINTQLFILLLGELANCAQIMDQVICNAPPSVQQLILKSLFLLNDFPLPPFQAAKHSAQTLVPVFLDGLILYHMQPEQRRDVLNQRQLNLSEKIDYLRKTYQPLSYLQDLDDFTLDLLVETERLNQITEEDIDHIISLHPSIPLPSRHESLISDEALDVLINEDKSKLRESGKQALEFIAKLFKLKVSYDNEGNVLSISSTTISAQTSEENSRKEQEELEKTRHNIQNEYVKAVPILLKFSCLMGKSIHQRLSQFGNSANKISVDNEMLKKSEVPKKNTDSEGQGPTLKPT